MLDKRLILLRKEKALTQEQVADIINVSRQTYASYENGVNPGLEAVIKLAKYFEVSIDYLAGITDVRENINIDPKVAAYINDCLNIYYRHIKRKD